MMTHLAMLDNYYDILAPPVYTHLSAADYSALFTVYKVIYPNYVSRHYVQELYELIDTTFLSRWALHLRLSQFPLSIQTSRGKFELHHMRTSISDVLQQTYPRWQSHQVYPYPHQADSSDIPLGNSDNTAFVLHLTCEPVAPTMNLETTTDTISR